MSADNGGPAFPVNTCTNEDGTQGHQTGNHTWQFPGMTLRDYFAAKAMQALITQGADVFVHTEDGVLKMAGLKGIPRVAYQYADAMLRARESA